MINAVKWIKNFIFGLFGMILFILFTLSVFTTCTINSDEVISYQRDMPFLHILAFAGVCAFGILLSKKARMPIRPEYVCLIPGVLLFALVFVTQLWPKGDSYILMNMAEHIAAGNYQDFLPGGYLYNQPHQIPMAYIFAALYRVFGASFVFICQGLNCIFIVGTLFLLKSLYRTFSGKISETGFYLVSFFFVPFFFYVTFVYGTLPGLFLALAACRQLMKYLELHHMRNAVLCIICIVLAKMIKSNYLIFAVGFAAILLYDLIKKFNLRHLAVTAALILSIAASSRAMNAFTERLTGVVSDGGIPAVLFVTMGLQESPSAPGWWNGFHDRVFLNSGFDPKEAARRGEKKLKERLDVMKTDPAYAADFMAKKISSEWSEPTYESLWIQQNRSSDQTPPELISRLFFAGGSLSKLYVFFCNLFQSFLYFFSLLFVIGKWKKVTIPELLLPVIFIGGFLFHILWEAKGQYTLPYCVCLLPMCVWGYGFALERLNRCRKEPHVCPEKPAYSHGHSGGGEDED